MYYRFQLFRSPLSNLVHQTYGSTFLRNCISIHVLQHRGSLYNILQETSHLQLPFFGILFYHALPRCCFSRSWCGDSGWNGMYTCAFLWGRRIRRPSWFAHRRRGCMLTQIHRAWRVWGFRIEEHRRGRRHPFLKTNKLEKPQCSQNLNL